MLHATPETRLTMKKLLTVILTMLCFQGAFAQEDGNGDGNFYVLGSLGFNPYNTDSDIKEFQKGYNDYWKSALTDPFSSNLFSYTYSLGAQYWISESVGFQYNIRYSTHSYKAAFDDGQKRLLDMNVRIPLEFGLLIGKATRHYANFSFGYGTSRMVSTREYKDGTRSLNFDSPLNGVFSASGFSYRLEYYRSIWKNVQLVAGIGGLIGSEYTDKNDIRGIDSRLGPYESKGFPKDFVSFNNTVVAGAAYDFPIDKWASLSYFTCSVGIVYRYNLFTLRSGL